METTIPDIPQQARRPDSSLSEAASETKAMPVLNEALLASLKPMERRLVIQFQTGHPGLTTEQAIKDLRKAGM